jgi:hypothetical protein
MSGFIEDGYDTWARLAAEPGLYEEVRFRYRPALSFQHAHVMAAPEGSDEREKRTVALLKSQLLEWDLKKRDGTVVEISEANLRRVQHLLRIFMYNIVVGVGASEGSIDFQAEAGNSSAE